MIYIVYYYKSNKLTIKEEYQSAYLAGFLKEATDLKLIPRNINLREVDPITFENDVEIVLMKPYSHESLKYLIQDSLIAREKSKNVKLVLYGYFSEVNYDILLKEYSFIDGVILGDLESTCNELIFKNVPLISCAGMAIMKDGEVCINHKPDLIDLNWVPKANRDVSIFIEQVFAEVQFSKGCLFNCSFCSEIDKKPVRFKSVETAVEELEYLNKELGFKNITIKDLSLEDRDILLGKGQLELFAGEIIKRNLNIFYAVHFRANSFNESHKPLLRRLRESGLNECLVGIESFSDTDLEFYNKGVNGNENINFIQLLKDCCIEPSCSFMFIHANAEIDGIKYNLEQAYKLNLLAFLPPLLNVMVVYKNTNIFNKLKAMGLAYTQVDNPYEVCVRYKDQSVSNIAATFKKFYMDKKVWDLYYSIKKINIELRDLEFKYNSTLLFDKDLISRINTTLCEINKINYNTMLQIVDLSMQNRTGEAEKAMKEHNVQFNDLYFCKLRDFRILLRKEIKGNEKLYSMSQAKRI